MTKVSIIMPCYNASAYLSEAIESVLSQSYKDWELLIIDDGSTDTSREIAKEYVGIDKRIHLIEQPNSGACRARNNGIEHAKGEYIKFLDADDILDKDCLKIQLEQIQTLQSNQIPFGDYGRIDRDSKKISDYSFSSGMLQQLQNDPIAFTFFHWEILITCPLHRKKQLQEIGLFDKWLPRHQETDLHFRLALAGAEFIYYPIHTFNYREYESESRISSRFEKGKIDKVKLNEVYYRKNESLLIDKYGAMPQIYRPSFADFYYGKAREAFARHDKANGMEYLRKSELYMPYTGTRWIYTMFGKIFGYVNIEALLRMRLRFLHKA